MSPHQGLPLRHERSRTGHFNGAAEIFLHSCLKKA